MLVLGNTTASAQIFQFDFKYLKNIYFVKKKIEDRFFLIMFQVKSPSHVGIWFDILGFRVLASGDLEEIMGHLQRLYGVRPKFLLVFFIVFVIYN